MSVGWCNREGGHGIQGSWRLEHHLLEGSEGVLHRAVVHISLLLGGSECFGGKFDVGDGWVGHVAAALEVAGDALWSVGVVAVELDGVCWC